MTKSGFDLSFIQITRKKCEKKVYRERYCIIRSVLCIKKYWNRKKQKASWPEWGMIKTTLKIEPHIDGLHNNLCALSASNFTIMWDSERWWARKRSLMTAEGRMEIPSSPFKKWAKKKNLQWKSQQHFFGLIPTFFSSPLFRWCLLCNIRCVCVCV